MVLKFSIVLRYNERKGTITSYNTIKLAAKLMNVAAILKPAEEIVKRIST